MEEHFVSLKPDVKNSIPSITQGTDGIAKKISNPELWVCEET